MDTITSIGQIAWVSGALIVLIFSYLARRADARAAGVQKRRALEIGSAIREQAEGRHAKRDAEAPTWEDFDRTITAWQLIADEPTWSGAKKRAEPPSVTGEPSVEEHQSDAPVTRDDLNKLLETLPDAFEAGVKAALNQPRPFPWLQLIATGLTGLGLIAVSGWLFFGHDDPAMRGPALAVFVAGAVVFGKDLPAIFVRR